MRDCGGAVLLRTASRRFFNSDGMDTSAHRRVAFIVPRYVLTKATQGAQPSMWKSMRSRVSRGGEPSRESPVRWATCLHSIADGPWELQPGIVVHYRSMRDAVLSIQPASRGRVARP